VTPNSIDKAEKIANAVLYEGYMLYPYRPSSTKNQQRCTFGTLYPDTHPDVLRGAEPCRNQMQCLVTANNSSTFCIRVRFLQMQSRELEGVPDDLTPEIPSWDEAVERMVDVELQVRETALAMCVSNFVPNLKPATCTMVLESSSAVFDKHKFRSRAEFAFRPSKFETREFSA
jgi:hypothetical protein